MFNLVSFVFLQIRLVNISSNDIVDGNPKLILGLVWSIILHWQVSLADLLLLTKHIIKRTNGQATSVDVLRETTSM